MRALCCLMLAGFGIVLSVPVWAHGIAGSGVFISTLTIDDPAAADKASFPTIIWQQEGAGETRGAANRFDLAIEFNKRITGSFGFGISDGYGLPPQTDTNMRGGWHNLSMSLKYPDFTSAEHELLMSLGVIRTFGRAGSTSMASDDADPTPPTIYFGKRLGDLPIGYFRPLAVTGTSGSQFADKRLEAAPATDPDTGTAALCFKNNIDDCRNGGRAGQYSFSYLQAQVKDSGLPAFFNRLTSLAGFAWSLPAGTPHAAGTLYLFAAGGAHGGAGYASTAGALDREAGTSPGLIAQLHRYLDDMFPNSLGKPLLQW
jgi:hypothetical protein